MPVTPDSRFASLPVLRRPGPDGRVREVVALRLSRPPLAEGTRHRVVQGETVDLLARRYYGDERLWWRIMDANPLLFPLEIEPGTELVIPGPGPATRVTRARSF